MNPFEKNIDKKNTHGLININEEIILFKDDLKHSKLIEDKIRRARLEIDAIQYELNNVKAVDLTKERVRVEYKNPIITKDYLIAKRENLEKQIEYLTQRLKRTNMILNCLPSKERNAVIEIYVQNKTYSEVAEKYFYSIKGMQKRINSVLKSSIEELIMNGNIVL